jgi:hypothetical protein
VQHTELSILLTVIILIMMIIIISPIVSLRCSGGAEKVSMVICMVLWHRNMFSSLTERHKGERLDLVPDKLPLSHRVTFMKQRMLEEVTFCELLTHPSVLHVLPV